MRILSILFLIIGIAFSANAKINVVATYPYIESIVKEVAKDKVNVTSLSDGKWDPHFVPPRPSLVVKLRNADLLIINGAQIEIGWLPPLINRASNGKILPGKLGFLDLSTLFELIQKPQVVSRAAGDVHPQGNPHFYLDPEKIPVIAAAISERLCTLDEQNCEFYTKNLKIFKENWGKKMNEWNEKMKPLNEISVFEYHRMFDYFFLRYNINVAGTLEPFPGIPPTTSHLLELVGFTKNHKVSLIAYAIYNPKDPVEFLSKKTGIKAVLLPHDVNSLPEVKDIYSLFDEIVRRLSK
jgi:zinc/manganese transport system substrate-binding protein